MSDMVMPADKVSQLSGWARYGVIALASLILAAVGSSLLGASNFAADPFMEGSGADMFVMGTIGVRPSACISHAATWSISRRSRPQRAEGIRGGLSRRRNRSLASASPKTGGGLAGASSGVSVSHRVTYRGT